MDNATLQRIAEHVDEGFLLEAVQGALRIQSLSGQEEEVARYFAGLMERVGLQTELQPVPGHETMSASFNTLGRLPGSTQGGTQRPSLLFNGHMDHNPVSDGWTKDPFGGLVEDGWLYGFVHMKAANACYLAAIDAVRRAGVPLGGDLTVALVCGELRGGTGTRHALA